ncbi:MAG: DUF354 domain-containing protein [Bacteroidales bacterium]|nr:DUF354 domain-containing protein [Bacteroidales bacterium]
MKIIFDLNHPAHLNFFKYSIKKLNNKHEVLVYVLRRGKLPNIVEKELAGINYKVIGRHRGNFLSIIFEANIFKFLHLLFDIWKFRPDLGVSVGGFVLGACMKIFRKPNIQFDDDPESSNNILLEKLTSNELFIPPIEYSSRKVNYFYATKEWSYLSPNYFIPNAEVLKYYDLEPKSYIFIREVSTGSLNYLKQEKNSILYFAKDLPVDCKVLFSLEDKKTKSLYPGDWILLREPVEDIHSLIYYSKILISSGDSMAREGAVLGIPSIYCGFREMKINNFVAENGLFYRTNPDKVIHLYHKLNKNQSNIQKQEKYRNKLKEEWSDITKFIIKNVEKYE